MHDPADERQHQNERQGDDDVVGGEQRIGDRDQPTVFSIGLPLVAATSGTEPEKPPCQVMKPM